MAILVKGTDFTTGDQVTATNLDNLVDAATFASGAVDNSTTQLSGGAIIVKDAGITSAKLASTTGSGAVALATSPTLVTPILGTPASGNLANCTGYVGTSALVTTGALNSGSITSGFGSIDIGADSLTAGAGSFTTLGASGLISMAAAASSVADNASGTYSRWRHNGANRLIIGTANQVYSGGSSADAAIFEESGSGSLRLGVGSTNSVTVSSTGLSCTGTLTATSSIKTYQGVGSGLPSANPAGQLAFVTDATSAQGTNSGATLVTGGASFRPVYSDGTNWKYF